MNIGGLQQQSLRMSLEQRPVRQIGQRVIVGEMFDLGRDAPPLGDVFQRGGPAAVRRALVDQPDHAAVGGRDDGVVDRVVLRVEKSRAIGVDVADERTQFLAMTDEVAQMATGLRHVRRYAEHVDVALIADDEPARGVEQQQSLGHVVDGGVEMLALLGEQPLRRRVLTLQLAHDQIDRGDHDDHGEKRRGKLQLALRPPVGERRRHVGGGDDQDRKIRQGPDRADPVLALGGVLEAPGSIAVQRQRLRNDGELDDVRADQIVVMRIAGDDGAVAVNHRDGGVAAQRQGSDEILEMRGLDAPGRKADQSRRGGR